MFPRLGFLVLFLALAACGAVPESTSSRLQSLSISNSAGPFPKYPDEQLTPGILCADDEADYRRHPEKVPYCERDVDSGTKRDIIREYDEELGFKVGSMQRSDFKIDHFIPLCVGGSNDRKNLWPQHKSVYEHTDAIENQLCNLMQRALMKQAEAVDTIRHVKFNLDEAAVVRRDLDERLQGNNR